MLEKNTTEKYSDIINLPAPISEKLAKMPILDRAAQFSPFAALSGYEDAVFETARITERRVELSEDMKAELDRAERLIFGVLDTAPLLTVTYFIPDKRKEGGEYRTVTSRPVKITDSVIILESGDRIPKNHISALSVESIDSVIEE